LLVKAYLLKSYAFSVCGILVNFRAGFKRSLDSAFYSLGIHTVG
jgi:hypothetical protein